MNSNILTIMKKELKRFFGDRRLFFTTVIMPGLMIYIIYSVLGNGLMDKFSSADDFVGKVAVENLPEGFDTVFDEMNIEIVDEKGATEKEIKEQVSNKDINAYVIFPKNFMQSTMGTTEATEPQAIADVPKTDELPNVQIFYNSTETDSQTVYSALTTMLDQYEASISNVFDINKRSENDEKDPYDLASEEDATGMLFSMMLPFLLLTFLFTGCMSISVDAIAGEKERGTIATLLVTPVKRSELAIGKILSLSIIGLLSGLSSFLGTMLALPKLMGDSMGDVNASVYSSTDFICLLLIILSTVLVIVGMISVVSAICKSVKEASTAATPLMLIVMFVGVSSMLSEAGKSATWMYLIPIYNSVINMRDIFSFAGTGINMILNVCSNVAVAAVLIFVLTKVFDSEKIMNH